MPHYSWIVCLAFMPTSIWCDLSQFPETPPPRIVEFIGQSLIPLGVNLALPEDFVAMPYDNEDPLYSPTMIWGRESDLKEVKKHGKDARHGPIIEAILSMDTFQTGPNSFNPNEKQIREESSKRGLRNLTIKRYQWGSYPVLAVQGIAPGNLVRNFAVVGMNDPSGQVLRLRLLAPKTAEKKALTIWENLLTNTKQLDGHANFQAHGQDLHPGYTIYSQAGAKLLAIAEKNRETGELLLAIKPLNDETSFTYEKMSKGKMGASFHYAEPLVKIYGTTKQSKYSAISFDVLSVLIKPVDQFTIDPNLWKLNPRNTVTISKG